MNIKLDRLLLLPMLQAVLGLAPLHAKPLQALGGEAGEDNAIAVCMNTAPFLMIDSLLGTPQPGGSWTLEGMPHMPVFIPGMDPAGTYCYVVGGDTAWLSITVAAPPNAGNDLFVSLCGDSLQELPLPSGADTTGYWVNCGQYVYCYVVEGVGTCPSDTAMVTVNIVAPPNAGVDNTITVCANAPPFLMIDSLLGEPAPWGDWEHWGIPVNEVFDPSTGASGTYIYTVPGVLPCVDDISNLTIMVLSSNDPQCLTTGMTSLSVASAMQSRPNPSNGQFTLSYPAQPEAGMLEVLDMQGRVVYQNRLAIWSQVHRVVLDGRAAGMYQCRVSWGAQREVVRVVIEP